MSSALQELERDIQELLLDIKYLFSNRFSGDTKDSHTAKIKKKLRND